MGQFSSRCLTRSANQGEGDDGFAMGPGIFLQFFQKPGFEVVRIGLHFAGGDFGLGSAIEAEVANPQITFRHERRSKGAAHHGTVFVKFAGSGRGVEHGARFVVGKLIPTLAIFVVFGFIEDTGGRIAGVLGGKSSDRVQGAFADASGAVGVFFFGLCQAVPKAERVELIDGKDSVTTMRTAGTAGQPFAAATHGVGEGSVDDLDEFLISGGRRRHIEEDNLTGALCGGKKRER